MKTAAGPPKNVCQRHGAGRDVTHLALRCGGPCAPSYQGCEPQQSGCAQKFGLRLPCSFTLWLQAWARGHRPQPQGSVVREGVHLTPVGKPVLGSGLGAGRGRHTLLHQAVRGCVLHPAQAGGEARVRQLAEFMAHTRARAGARPPSLAGLRMPRQGCPTENAQLGAPRDKEACAYLGRGSTGTGLRGGEAGRVCRARWSR